MFSPADHASHGPRFRPVLLALTLTGAAALSACGGGGSGGGEVTPPPPPADGPDLSVSMSLPGAEVPAGYTQTMATVKLSNHGKGTAGTTDFNIVADAVLQDLKVVNCKSDNPGTACPATGSRMTVSNLLPGASITVDVVGMVKLGTSGTVKVEASASTSNGTQLSSSRQSVGFKAYSVDLGVQVAGPTSAVPAGANFDYVVTVRNSGPDVAKEALLGLAFTSSPAANQPTLGAIRCAAAGGAVCPTELKVGVMTLPNVPKDGSLVFTLPYQFAPGVRAGLIFNAGVRASGDSDTSNDSSTLITP